MIENKVVVITGAGSGIGAATATLLAERGAKVVLGARRKDRLDALAAKIGATSLPTDVRKAGDVANLVRLARERHGRLDVRRQARGTPASGRSRRSTPCGSTTGTR